MTLSFYHTYRAQQLVGVGQHKQDDECRRNRGRHHCVGWFLVLRRTNKKVCPASCYSTPNIYAKINCFQIRGRFSFLCRWATEVEISRVNTPSFASSHGFLLPPSIHTPSWSLDPQFCFPLMFRFSLRRLFCGARYAWQRTTANRLSPPNKPGRIRSRTRRGRSQRRGRLWHRRPIPPLRRAVVVVLPLLTAVRCVIFLADHVRRLQCMDDVAVIGSIGAKSGETGSDDEGRLTRRFRKA